MRGNGKLRVLQVIPQDAADLLVESRYGSGNRNAFACPVDKPDSPRWSPQLERFYAQETIRNLLNDLRTETGIVRLSDAEFIIDVGFGVGNRDGYEAVIEPLEQALRNLGVRNLSIGGSRKVTEELHLLAGRPPDRPVGRERQSRGALAIGISGAPQHLNYHRTARDHSGLQSRSGGAALDAQPAAGPSPRLPRDRRSIRDRSGFHPVRSRRPAPSRRAATKPSRMTLITPIRMYPCHRCNPWLIFPEPVRFPRTQVSVRKNEESCHLLNSSCFLEGVQGRPVRSCASSARYHNHRLSNNLQRRPKALKSEVCTFEVRHKSLRALGLYRALEGAHGKPNFEQVRIFEKMAGFCISRLCGVDSVECGGLDIALVRFKKEVWHRCRNGPDGAAHNSAWPPFEP